MSTKLQCKHSHKRLGTITVNGRTYNIDSEACVVIDDSKAEGAADAKKLLSLNGEWSSTVRALQKSAPRRIPEPGRPLRNAVDFVDLLKSDTPLAEKVADCKSFKSVQSIAFNMGFKFNENEFKDATQSLAKSESRAVAVAAEHAAMEVETKRVKREAVKLKREAEAAGLPAPDVGDKLTPEEELVVAEAETSDEWPDPAESMSLGMLRRMAEVYAVKYAPSASKADLVPLIKVAMYGEEDDAGKAPATKDAQPGA